MVVGRCVACVYMVHGCVWVYGSVGVGAWLWVWVYGCGRGKGTAPWWDGEGCIRPPSHTWIHPDQE